MDIIITDKIIMDIITMEQIIMDIIIKVIIIKDIIIIINLKIILKIRMFRNFLGQIIIKKKIMIIMVI
jgi:hypothetical protein